MFHVWVHSFGEEKEKEKEEEEEEEGSWHCRAAVSSPLSQCCFISHLPRGGGISCSSLNSSRLGFSSRNTLIPLLPIYKLPT